MTEIVEIVLLVMLVAWVGLGLLTIFFGGIGN